MGKRRGNGAGTVYPEYAKGDTKKKYAISWRGQYKKPNGKRGSVSAPTQKEAQDKLNQVLADIKRKQFVDRNGKTVRKILEEILEEQEKLNKITDSTILRNKNTAKHILGMVIIDKPIQKVSADEINKCLQKLTYLSNSYIDKIYMKLNNVFNEAVLQEILIVNPFTVGRIKKPRSNNEDKKVEAFTIEEHKAFLQELQQLKENDYTYRVIFYICIETGMRIGEVLALKRGDIDFKDNVIHVERTLTKDKFDKATIGNKTKTFAGMRKVPLSNFLKSVLEQYIDVDNDKFLFRRPNGKFITASGVNSKFKRICTHAHIKECIDVIDRKKEQRTINLKSSEASTHWLRHTYATRCIEAGMTAVVLQRILRTFQSRYYT